MPEESAGSDSWMAELQRQVVEQEEECYSAQVLEHARHPRNVGAILDPDAHSALRGPCGDTIEFFLRLAGSTIDRAAFLTDGCGPTIACGSMLTTMIRGMTVEQAAAIDAGDLLIVLGGMPPDHVHCATLAVSTLREALAQRRLEGETGSA